MRSLFAILLHKYLRWTRLDSVRRALCSILHAMVLSSIKQGPLTAVMPSASNMQKLTECETSGHTVNTMGRITVRPKPICMEGAHTFHTKTSMLVHSPFLLERLL